MTRQKSVLRQIALRLPEIASFCCAALMLCVIPLYFDDAFFNINRCKVSLIRMATPWLLALMAVSLCVSRLPGGKKRLEGSIAPDICMAAFLLACVIACARQGFNEDVTEAANGRNLGLWLMLCLCAAYYIVALGEIDGRLLAACMLLCAAICAGLGILNAAGIDPLGFYQNIKRKLKITFFSTIGNADFFGTYLLMMFGMAAGVMLFSKKRAFRLSAAGCAILLILGMLVSRTDSAAAGMLLVCLTMLVLSCGNWMRMGCAAILWAVCLALIPAAQAVLNKNPYHPQMDGLLSLLMKTHAVHVLPVVLVVAAAVFTWLGRRGVRAPSRKAASRVVLIAAAVMLVGFICATVWFTVVKPEADLGGLSAFLRFDDQWGNYRGFVYIRSLRAFADYSLADKLLGKGLGRALAALTPYFDNPDAIAQAGGVFTDAHCQILQFLLTCGLFGAFAFLTFYMSMLYTCANTMGDDPILCGCFAALAGYLIVIAINVAQPILLSTYFPLCGLAVSRMRRLKKGAVHES